MVSEEQIKLMRKLACVLHSVLFGSLCELKKEKGFFGVWEHVTRGISHLLGGYLTSLSNANIEDILSDLQETGLYKGLELKREGNKFTFKVEKCLFAGGEEGVHKQLKPLDVSCPLALFIGGHIAKENPSKRVYAYPSIFTEEGSIIEIELLTLEDYEEKRGDLGVMAQVEKEMINKKGKAVGSI